MAKSDPRIAKAHNEVAKAINEHRLVPSIICADCSIEDFNTQAHHEDYNNPLLVVWLCTSCHGKRHVGRLMSASPRIW